MLRFLHGAPRGLHPEPEQRTVAVYSGALAVTAIFCTLLWLYTSGNRRLEDRVT